MGVRMIYPADLVSPFQVDDAFKDEAEQSGAGVILFDQYNSRLVRSGSIVSGDKFLYRGWILSADDYSVLEDLINSCGASLVVSSVEYVKSQFMNFWYEAFKSVTPVTEFVDYGVSGSEIFGVASSMGCEKFYVKGVSKSLKNYSIDYSVAGSVDDVVRVVNNFRSVVSQSEEQVIAVREFEDWSDTEFRTWWVNGSLVRVEFHPDTFSTLMNDAVSEFGVEVEVEAVMSSLGDFTDRVYSCSGVLGEIGDGLRSLGLSFAAVDVVFDNVGNLRVVEVGSGQVCDTVAGFFNIFDLGELGSCFSS